jgi:hypothetical protein
MSWFALALIAWALIALIVGLFLGPYLKNASRL